MSEQTSKAWLQRLKDESWEAELLVAAISIYGTLQLFVFVEWVTDVFIDTLPQSFYFVAYGVVYSALAAFSILSSMFIIHFMLRAYWVGLVGLNSVFADYHSDNTPNTALYMKKLVETLPKLEHSIEQADRLCSVIFSAAFGFLLGYGWMFIVSALYLLIANALIEHVSVVWLLIPALILAMPSIIQLTTLALCNTKTYRNHEALNTFHHKMSLIAAKIGFGPFYKVILQISSTFSSNFKNDKTLVGLVLLFFVCGLGMATFRMLHTNIPYLIFPELSHNPTKAEPRYYKNQSEGETLLVAPQLNNNVISNGLIEVFVPVFLNESKQYKKHCEALKSVDGATREERGLASIACLNQYHQIKIDGKPATFSMMKTLHHETKQHGILVYVKLNNQLQDGLYKIEISKTIYSTDRVWNIPFYSLSQ